jgi:RNA polymerase sigma-70 factor (ECF subfamily)
MLAETAIWCGPVTVVESQDPDQHLIVRAQAGDEQAFATLYSRYQAPIARLAANLTRRPDDTPDLVQEIFTKVYFALHRVRSDAPFRPWLYRVAGNHCLDYLRKNKRQPVTTSFEPEYDNAWTASHEANPARSHEARDLVSKLFHHLKPRDRWLLVMKEIEGLSLEEMAAITGMANSALKVALFRARKRLQRQYQTLGRRIA